MAQPLTTTLELLSAHDEPEHVAAVFGSALAEPSLVGPCLECLLRIAHGRAPREILRRYDQLPGPVRSRALDVASDRLLVAAQQLALSRHVETRANVAAFASDLLAMSSDEWSQVLSLLIVLIDDPQHVVRDRARRCFLDGLADIDIGRLARTITPKHPVVLGLGLLLRHFSQHHDEQVLRALFAIGVPGVDLLARAVGENWDAADTIERFIGREDLDGNTAMTVVDGLFRWLRSPYDAARDSARRTLRGYTSPSWLRLLASRLESDDVDAREQEFAVYRNIRWELLPTSDLDLLTEASVLRVAGYVQASSASPEERAERLAQLLAVSHLEVKRQVLIALKELPTNGILSQLATQLHSPDESQQLLATQLLESDGTQRVFELLVAQLASPHDKVRAAAQRKLSGQSLSIFFDAFGALSQRDRRQLVPILEKVDTHFTSQLRRALRSRTPSETTLAIRTILAGQSAKGAMVSQYEDSLFDLTVNPNAWVRATLARCFEFTDREAGLHYLRLYLNDPDDRVVANSIETLGRVGEPRALPWVAEYREHATPRVRVNALLASYRYGDRDALARLAQLANATNSDAMRASAEWALESCAMIDAQIESR